MNTFINNDNAEWIVAGTISVVGWFAAFILNWYLQKRNIRALAKEKTYHTLIKSISDTQQKCDAMFNLTTAMGTRITVINETKSLQPVVSPFPKDSPLADLKVPLKEWSIFLDEYSSAYSSLTVSTIALIEDCGVWQYTFPKLNTALKSLQKEGSALNADVIKFFFKLQDVDFESLTPEKEKYYDKQAKALGLKLATYMGYLHDLRVLLNNHLLAKVYGYSRDERNEHFGYVKLFKLTTSKQFTVLTQSGIKSKRMK